MVFQHFELFPHMNVRQNLTLAQVKVLGRGQQEATEKGLKLLDRVGLKAHAEKYPGQLSGGQQQRVAIARALLARPQVLLADEPTGNLDAVSGEGIIRLFQRMAADGMTVLVVTHEERVSEAATRVLHLEEGRLR
jgi:glutamate/aspartate transport system ATP-binding protein